MPNDLFRELTSIARDYVDEYSAHSLIVECCGEAGTSPDDVSSGHISGIILNITTNVELVEKLEPYQFTRMMKDFIAFSHTHGEDDPKRIRMLVRERNGVKG